MLDLYLSPLKVWKQTVMQWKEGQRTSPSNKGMFSITQGCCAPLSHLPVVVCVITPQLKCLWVCVCVCLAVLGDHTQPRQQCALDRATNFSLVNERVWERKAEASTARNDFYFDHASTQRCGGGVSFQSPHSPFTTIPAGLSLWSYHLTCSFLLYSDHRNAGRLSVHSSLCHALQSMG